jgi:hypothetical protein
MDTMELHLDQETRERAQRLATARHCSLEQFLERLLERLLARPADLAEIQRALDALEQEKASKDPLLGLFAKEPQLIDQVMEVVYKAREEHPLRQPGG